MNWCYFFLLSHLQMPLLTNIRNTWSSEVNMSKCCLKSVILGYRGCFCVEGLAQADTCLKGPSITISHHFSCTDCWPGKRNQNLLLHVAFLNNHILYICVLILLIMMTDEDDYRSVRHDLSPGSILPPSDSTNL